MAAPVSGAAPVCGAEPVSGAEPAPAAPMPVANEEYRVGLGGSGWSVWRDVAVRSAGFPAGMVLGLCDEGLAAAADAAGADGAGDVAGREAFGDVFERAAGRLVAGVGEVWADRGFREALTWQNPGLAQFLRDHDPGPGPGVPRRSKQRQRELVIASYLQRYCWKNDTIGFFGPVGWARADPGTAGLVVVPGERVIARRNTYFEVWAIDKVAAAIAARGRAAGWLVPRRTRSVLVAGGVLHRPHRPPVVLSGAEVEVLAACDGRRTVAEVLAGAGGPDGPAGPDAAAVLARLVELGALRMDLEGPAHAWPERLLAAKLEAIGDPVARAAALGPVQELVRARDAVAAAAGDPEGVGRALADLAATFERVTGSAATRRPGENYAGRTLVYQDAVRDVEVVLGAAVTGALAGPLGLVLDSARWLVNDITDRYRACFADLVDRESVRAGGGPVPLQRLLTRAAPYLSAGASGRGVGELATASVAELQARWRHVLGPVTDERRHQVSTEAIRARAAECFPARPVAWSGARHHSPDIMIAAASAQDVEAGNFLLILGELHMTHNTLANRCFVEQHPDPARLIAAEQADRGPDRIVTIAAKDYRTVSSRTNPPSAMLGPGLTYWSSAVVDSFEPPGSDPVLAGAALSVVRRGDDLVVLVAPSGAELDFFEVIADAMIEVVVDAFQPTAPAAHRPRITIDKLVLCREQWTFTVEDSSWAFAKDEPDRYYQARRWRARHQLPERVFYRVPGELKPAAADFSSIVLVNLLAKHIRQTRAAGHTHYTITEMLPDLNQLWLTDHHSHRYSAELRLVTYDDRTQDQAPSVMR
jgi:Lantibiotic dehydratase, N terminus